MLALFQCWWLYLTFQRGVRLLVSGAPADLLEPPLVGDSTSDSGSDPGLEAIPVAHRARSRARSWARDYRRPFAIRSRYSRLLLHPPPHRLDDHPRRIIGKQPRRSRHSRCPRSTSECRRARAQQLSIWAVVPIIGIILGELSGQFELTVLVAVIATLILIPVAVLVTWGAAHLFQREAILTRWR